MWQGKHIGARGLGHEGALTFLPETFTHCPNGSGLKSGCKRTKITWKTKTFTISTSKETAIIPKRIVLKACILNMASSNSVNPVKSKNMFLEITPTLLFCNAFPQVSLPESRAFFPKIHRSWGGGGEDVQPTKLVHLRTNTRVSRCMAENNSRFWVFSKLPFFYKVSRYLTWGYPDSFRCP